MVRFFSKEILMVLRLFRFAAWLASRRPRPFLSWFGWAAAGLSLIRFDSPAQPVAMESGHADIRIVYDPTAPGNPLSLALADDGQFFSPTNMLLRVRESARIELPGGTPFGEGGETFWILPQSQDASLPYLGISAEGLPRNVFDGPMEIALIDVAGPGQFFLWQANQFGELEIKMSTADGLGPDDRTSPIVGSHEHLNWGFTSNGVYQLTFEARGRRLGEHTNILSLPTTLTFEVLPLPEPSASPFLQWLRARFGPSASLELATSDPDGDGLGNAAEYALGSDPLSASSAHCPRLVPSGPGAPSPLVVEFPRPAAAPEARLVLEYSPQLSSPLWTVLVSGPAATLPGTETHVQIPLPPGPASLAEFYVRILAQIP